MSKSEPANEFTVWDWIGVIYTAGSILGFFAFSKVSAASSKMYAAFGGQLPLLTNIVTKPWVSILIGVICLCVFSLQGQKWVRLKLKRRRIVVVVSFLLASITSAVFLIGFYLPIFKMAGALE